MRFSLVTCTLGRTDEVVELFESLVRQKRSDFEVVLVDQNPDDRLVPIVDQFSGRFPLRHLRICGSGASRARNAGIAFASGELIGFPDDDCQYLDGYLDAIDSIFSREPSMGGLCGNPTAEKSIRLEADCSHSSMCLSKFSLLNRCQEFTVFVRRESLGSQLYNEHLGVGSGSLWGAEEGPDLLIRLVEKGVRLAFFPRLLVFHPNKVDVVSRSTLQRAESYARGRGCLLRLHHFPVTIVAHCLVRPAAGCVLYLLKLQPMRSVYYFVILRGVLRGLFMSEPELTKVRAASARPATPARPLEILPLSRNPLVTVLLANYNYEQFLPAALDSLVAQTYSHWHAIVCDDGSTDRSRTIVEEFARRDPRITLVTKQNGGQNSAFNTCARYMCGEIVCLLDADDIFAYTKLARVVECFQANAKAGVCNHFSKVIDSEGKPQSVVMHKFLDSGWQAEVAVTRGACVYVPTTSCMSLRREIAEQLFPIPHIQDRDLDGYVAMAAQFLTPICVIPEQLSSYRLHGGNMGGATEPTPQRLRYELHLIQLRTTNVKEFLRERFGEMFAAQIVMENNPQYIQAALKLHAVERTHGLSPQAASLIRQHPNPQWRILWRLLFAAPAWITRLAVPCMHRSIRIKSLVHKLLNTGQPAGI